LLDQGLPRSAASILRNHGWDAVHTADIGMSRAEDTAVLETAREQGRTVITLDADFHALLAVSRAAQPSVPRIRQEGLNGEQIAALIESVFARIGDQFEQGIVVTAANGRMRTKRLPIGD